MVSFLVFCVTVVNQQRTGWAHFVARTVWGWLWWKPFFRMDVEKCFHRGKTIEENLTEMRSTNSGKAEENFIEILVFFNKKKYLVWLPWKNKNIELNLQVVFRGPFICPTKETFFVSLAMHLGYGNLSYIKYWISDTLHKRMLLIVLRVGDLTAYAMAYFSFMKEEPFLLIKALSSRTIPNNSHRSCLDYVPLNTIRNEAE